MPCWIAAAHDSARLGPVNISMMPSPVRLHLDPTGGVGGAPQDGEVGLAERLGGLGPETCGNAVDPTRSVNRKVAVIGVLIVAPERCKDAGRSTSAMCTFYRKRTV